MNIFANNAAYGPLQNLIKDYVCDICESTIQVCNFKRSLPIYTDMYNMYRSARNTRCAGVKIASNPPTAQTHAPNWLIF